MPQIHPTLPADGDDAVVEPYNAALNQILGVLNGAIDVDNLADGGVTLSKLSSAIQAALVPTGSINAYGGSAAPTGFLMCDGSSYLRASYSALFAVLGTAYGSADGTHFNVPDLRGRTPVGTDNLGGSAANRIQRTTTLTTTSGSPTATVGSVTGISVGMFVTNANVPAGTTVSAISGTTLTLSANATATASTVAARFSLVGNDANVLGSVGGVDVQTLIQAQLPSHTHDITKWALGSGTDYSGNKMVGDQVNGAATGNSAATDIMSGGLHDQPHPNMQPSVLVSYIIKT